MTIKVGGYEPTVVAVWIGDIELFLNRNDCLSCVSQQIFLIFSKVNIEKYFLKLNWHPLLTGKNYSEKIKLHILLKELDGLLLFTFFKLMFP